MKQTMKFDVVLSNPPFRTKEDGWIKHVYKHLSLLDDDSYYALVCPADTSEHIIREICKRFDTIKVQKIKHFDDLEFLDNEVYYYIWKK